MTAPLDSDLRAHLGRVIQEARRVAEAGAHDALAALAVGEAKPHQHMSLTERGLRNQLRVRGRQAGDRAGKSSGTQQIARLAHEVAYEHWHRMLFARFLAENQFLIASAYGVPVSLEDCRDIARETGRDPWELAGEWAQGALPGVFAAAGLLLRISLPPETVQRLEVLLDSLPNAVFIAQDSLGWTYQYWRTQEKDRINASGVKIGANELPAVTQLFTERYMVHFILHNTVGAWWAGKVMAANPGLAEFAPDEAALRDAVRLTAGDGYDFTYLRFTQSMPGGDEDAATEEDGLVDDAVVVPWRPAAGTFSDWPRSAHGFRFLDPCCGSGHFLVEALELLTRLRMEEEGLAIGEAVCAVLRDNLFGLEIDPRCAEISAFSVALSAWRLAREPVVLPALSVACCGIAPEGSAESWAELADDLEGLAVENRSVFDGDSEDRRGPLQDGMRSLHRLFRKAPVLGSLIDPADMGNDGQRDLLSTEYESLRDLFDVAVERERKAGYRDERVVAAAGLASAAKMLQGRYTLVATNVPFLARGRQRTQLRDFADCHYRDARADLATVFIARIFRWLGDHGTQAVVTPQNWLFLGSYQRLRERLLRDRRWNLIVRLGSGAFETIGGEVVNVAMVVLSAGGPAQDWSMAGLNASVSLGQGRVGRALRRARFLAGGAKVMVSVQADQLENPSAVVMMRPVKGLKILGHYISGHAGLQSGDYPAYGRLFWEMSSILDSDIWTFQQSTVKRTVDFGGREHVLHWEGVNEIANEELPSGRKAVRIQGGGNLES